MSSSESKNLRWVTYMQTVCILLVVTGHSFYMYPDGCQGYLTLVVRLIYDIHMPAFIFISGFLLALSLQFKAPEIVYYGKFLKKKFMRLLLPFLVLTTITFVPRCFLSSLADDPVSLDWESFFASFIYSDRLVIPYLWFNVALFILQMGFYPLYFLHTKAGTTGMGYALKCLIWILPLGLFIMPLCIDYQSLQFLSLNKVMSFGFYFLAGAFYFNFQSKINGFLRIDRRLTPWLLTALWVVSFFTISTTQFYYLDSLIGIFMLIAWSKRLEGRKRCPLDHLMGCNYVIFLLSWYFNTLSQQALGKVFEFPWYLHTVISIITGIYGPWCIYKLLVNNYERRWCRGCLLLLGQKITVKKPETESARGINIGTNFEVGKGVELTE